MGLPRFLVAVVIAMSGCVGSGAPPMLDGWSIGERVTECRSDVPAVESCEQLVALAATGIRLPPSTPGTLHREGAYVGRNGEQILSNRSGGTQYVAVLEPPGGPRRAAPLYCSIGECHPGGRPAYRP